MRCDLTAWKHTNEQWEVRCHRIDALKQADIPREIGRHIFRLQKIFRGLFDLNHNLAKLHSSEEAMQLIEDKNYVKLPLDSMVLSKVLKLCKEEGGTWPDAEKILRHKRFAGVQRNVVILNTVLGMASNWQEMQMMMQHSEFSGVTKRDVTTVNIALEVAQDWQEVHAIVEHKEFAQVTERDVVTQCILLKKTSTIEQSDQQESEIKKILKTIFREFHSSIDRNVISSIHSALSRIPNPSSQLIEHVRENYPSLTVLWKLPVQPAVVESEKENPTPPEQPQEVYDDTEEFARKLKQQYAQLIKNLAKQQRATNKNTAARRMRQAIEELCRNNTLHPGLPEEQITQILQENLPAACNK